MCFVIYSGGTMENKNKKIYSKSNFHFDSLEYQDDDIKLIRVTKGQYRFIHFVRNCS